MTDCTAFYFESQGYEKSCTNSRSRLVNSLLQNSTLKPLVSCHCSIANYLIHMAENELICNELYISIQNSHAAIPRILTITQGDGFNRAWADQDSISMS